MLVTRQGGSGGLPVQRPHSLLDVAHVGKQEIVLLIWTTQPCCDLPPEVLRYAWVSEVLYGVSGLSKKKIAPHATGDGRVVSPLKLVGLA